MTYPRIHLRPSVAADAMNAVGSRSLDIIVASVALLVLALPMLAVACAIAVDDLPILFVQTRLGKHSQPFSMFKFRKFRSTCGTDGCPLTMAMDARMTRVGRFLAATKLDELPQLWNVLRGDMAIIGPRPESLAFADCFQNGFEQILEYKPGLLGPSQIVFRNECKLYPSDMDPTRFYREVLFPAKARLDLAYFPHRSVPGDIRWLLRGVLAVFGWVPEQPAPLLRASRLGADEVREATKYEASTR